MSRLGLFSFTVTLLLSYSLFGQVIEMQKSGRTFEVPCKVNGLNLRFILDTGADKVSISLTEALFMIKNGYLSKGDLLGTEYHQLADGKISEGTKVILRTIEVGGLTLKNVEASVIHSLEAPLLFGQSALERFGEIKIDYKNSNLVIGEGKEVKELDNTIFVESGKGKYINGDYLGAIQDYDTAIALRPSDFMAYYNRGVTKALLGEHMAAVSDFNRVIELNASYSNAFANRAWEKFRLDDNIGAIQDCDKAIELDYSNSYAFEKRGWIRSKLGDIKGAIDDYNRLVEMEPSNGNAYVLRGWAKDAAGDRKGACIDWSKAGELGEKRAYTFIKENCN